MNINEIFLIRQFLEKLGKPAEEAQGLVEYAIIILLVALVVMGTLGFLGGSLGDVYQRIIEMVVVG